MIADIGFIVVSSSNLLGSPIRPVDRNQYMYEPRYGHPLDWVCIIDQQSEGTREESDGGKHQITVAIGSIVE